MSFIHRLIESQLHSILNMDKSILLLGPRQTGKTTLLKEQFKPDLNYSFVKTQQRRRFEMNPELLIKEIKGHISIEGLKRKPIVIIDEIQKVPIIMDVIQDAIDEKLANFILTGSSARKLKRDNHDINLLPGRVLELHLDGLSLLEMSHHLPELDDLLLNGSLPEIILQADYLAKEKLLTSYVNIYLEEEIRAEALVRNLASFSRFLTYAAVDAGKQLNASNLSRELGISRNTILDYYQILEDCLIADRIEPITNHSTRKRLTKSPKYLFFDLGVRRVAAAEGLRLPSIYFSDLFEQFVGIEILKLLRIFAPQAKLRYWRDHAGPEVDYVIEYNRQYIPIEVKWTSTPKKEHAKHLITFMQEYDCVKPAYIICRTPRAVQINEQVIAIPWQVLAKQLKELLA